MIKIDITLNIAGNDTKLSYAEGEVLFNELSVLYGNPVVATKKSSVYGESFGETEDAATCGPQNDCNMSMNDFPNSGKEVLADCGSSIPVSKAGYVTSSDHNDSDIPNDEPDELAIMQDDIDKRIAAMKKAVAQENNK